MTAKITTCKREAWMGENTKWAWDGYHYACASQHKPVWDEMVKETHGSRWVAKSRSGHNSWVTSLKDFVKRSTEEQRKGSLRRIQ